MRLFSLNLKNVYPSLKSRVATFTAGTLVVFAAVLVSALYVTNAESAIRSVDLSTMTHDEKVSHWKNRIETTSDDHAYQEFKASAPSVQPNEVHWELHIFSDALYDLEGLGAIETCDTQADYACFHAVMIRAVDEYGASGAGKLYGVCIEQLGEYAHECLHGIGHGLLSLFGYSMDGLARAVDICDDYPDPNPRMAKYGCTSGAVMEFNMHTMNSGAETPRPFSFDIALEPCLSMESRENREACTFWQPQWWIASLKHEPPLTMAKHIGELCRAMNENDTKMYHVCVQGIGNRISSVIDFDPSRTAEICLAIDPDPEARFVCHRATAFRFSRYFPLEKAATACDGLSKSESDRCRTRLSEAKEYDDRASNF